MNEIERFRARLEKINIKIELVGNIPWIYLHKVNGNVVQKEDWINANHGYTVAWHGVKIGSEPHLNWLDMKETFRIIRKYK